MTAAVLLTELRSRGAFVAAVGDRLHIDAPVGVLSADLRTALAVHKTELLRLLLLDRIESSFQPGEWLAYRDADNQLTSAKYAGTSTSGAVNVWLADGAVRAIEPEAVALDWAPDAAEVFEERLAIMLDAGVPEEKARVRAEQCTREYLARLRGGAA
jgi:TubC N-terminal docking domain